MPNSYSPSPAVRRASIVTFWIALAALALTRSSHVTVDLHAQSTCGPLINPIVCENQKAGDPASQWDITGSGDASIQGFATTMSVTPGQTQSFKVSTPSSNYSIDIYRMGYYAGMGARKIATVAPSVSLPQSQPSCLSNASTGLVDCGNWGLSASWTVPADAVSGIYIAKLNRNDTGGASHILFVVRESDTAPHHSDVVFQTSDTTWQAYNQYGGNSLYVGSPAGRAYKVSYNRPVTTRGTGAEDAAFNAEYPMVRWLESNGYDVSYISGVDSDRSGTTILTPTKHKVFLSVGHDEYWSGAQRANVEAARAAGLHMVFLSGNEVFWKTRWESSIDASATPYRTLVCYKETHANAVIDPADPTVWTGTWRDPRFSPPADGGRPENSLTGQLFLVNNGDTTSITVPAAEGKMRFWRNTTVATLAAGAVATMPNGTLGYEWDGDVDNGFRPNGLIALSSTTRSVSGKLLDYGSTFGAGSVTHKLSLYRHPSGALVFGAGTVQWTWGLDANHDRGSAAADVRMRQATVNLLADMGVQPATLQSGLVATAASTDALPPTSTITSPAAGTSLAAGTPVTISGTATDAGGGLVAGVEISVDGGTRWVKATGTTSWTFSWAAAGSVTIKSRGYDDSGNTETPSAGVAVTVTASRVCPCSLWSASTVPPAPLDDGDTGSVELGTKFRVDASGYITGVRFYKASTNTGVHTGSLWTGTGVQLGSVTFSGETASGWQQALFPTAIPVSAGTTYVVSYHAPVGHYTGTDPFFATGVDNPPLHALADGLDGLNGVYAYSASTQFPANGFNSENYWVDVVYNTTPPVDNTLPTVTLQFPTAGATGIDPATSVTATFSEAMNEATISSSTTGSEGGATFGTFELRDPSSNLVTATVSYDSATKIATLRPASSLALSTTYTALLKGGATDPRVKDLAGNALAANLTWTFTTAAAPPPPISCPCTIWSPSVAPSPVDDNDSTPVELGTKFQSEVPGFITGARFYKGPLNTGVHVAKLWNGIGTLLGTATFAGESASGWQEVAFPAAIPIAASTTYVISYRAPNGHYPAPDNYFKAAGVDNRPLHALKDGVDGANGVYAYGASTFPTSTYLSESYFIDVVFNTTTGPDVTAPVVASVSPATGSSGIRTNVSLTATFNEAMNAATISSSTLLLRDPLSVTVPSIVAYTAATRTATITSSSPLAYSTTYTGVVKGGTVNPRVTDAAGNALVSDYTWTFTTAAPPPPPPTQGPGGPVLVVTSTSNPFSSYYAEILRNEGLNAFATLDISQVSASTLGSYDLVVLGEMTLSPAQVTMFTTWVTAGGNLIAMRPDKQLAGLLGLTDAASTLANTYLLVNTASAPGAGIVNQTMQFHGTADRYTLNGATSIATLYSNATTATVNPAVTMRTVGANGHAVAFTYDLARSVVTTRQGNPAWAGQERDAIVPVRSDDLFFGAKMGDVQPDWVDLNKVAIPQADEQQRFLWNIILQTNASRKPLPRFWYLPRMFKAVVIMTGDDHGNNGTSERFDGYITSSPHGCSVVDWECIRATSYMYPNTPMSDGQAQQYVAQGFELGVHINTNCLDWTTTSLPLFYSTQLTQFAAAFPHVPAPTTNRTHCIVWSDYATQPQVELNTGIRLDTSYYYYPSTWILDRPGMFTGSGMPMRFATQTGQMIDVYQAASQMTDESGQTFPKNIDTLLDNALGSTGYYGAFTANMHTDFNPSAGSLGSDAIIASAQARGVPVISARQMLDWLDGRNGSAFQSLSWNGTVLSFNIAVGAGANGLQTLVPATVGASPITGITLNGGTVVFTQQTIKGVQYAIFPAGAGSYQVSYGPDIAPPTISALTASAIGTTTATVTWTTNEAADTLLRFGTSAGALSQSVSNPTLSTSHTVPLTGLLPNTTYYYQATSADAAGNSSVSPTGSPLSFTTAAPFVTGTITPVASGSGATLTLSGAASATTTANGSGAYTFSGLSNGAYTVTPSKAGYTFAPTSQPVTLSGAGVSGLDFAVQPVLISGTLTTAGSGGTVTLSGAGTGVSVADGSGNYIFSAVADGTYLLTPSKNGYTFAPATQQVTIAGGSATGISFTAQPVIVSGTISPVLAGGVTVTLSGTPVLTTTTDPSGVYTFTAVTDGARTVTPSKLGFTFTPANRAVTINRASVAGLDFAAQAVPTWSLSGAITPAASGSGATVALTGGATASVVADASGNYAFTGLPNGSYTVTVTKTGFSFTPPSQTVAISGASGNANFTAQAAAAIGIDTTGTLSRSTSSRSIAVTAFSTTGANELLLAFIATDNNTGTTTITNVTGGSLTWQLVRRTNAQRGTSEIWRAFAPAVLTNISVTATISQSVPASLTVMSFKGVDTTGTSGSGAIGATASGSANPGAPTATLTTTRANSLVVGVGNDWDTATARTVGPNQTMVQQYLATVGDTFWVQRLTNPVAAAGTVVIVNDTAPAADQYNLTICEIRSAP